LLAAPLARRRPLLKNLPTGTVTFLFTDIEGATTLLQRLGDRRYAEVLAEHQRLLRDAFAKGNGWPGKQEGNGRSPFRFRTPAYSHSYKVITNGRNNSTWRVLAWFGKWETEDLSR